MSALGACTAASCISTATVVELLAMCAGCWGIGYAIGDRIKWIRRISELA